MAGAGADNTYHRIRGFAVKGGFLDGVEVEFADNLNCVIGGRGTGKTTVIETLRWALNRMPEQTDAHKRIDRLIAANLGDGSVEVEIETQSGLRYKAQRTRTGEALVLNESGEPVDIDIGRGTIFSADFYSQHEIEEIANDPLFQLKLIDKFVADDLSEIEGEIQARVRELSGNANEIIKLRGDVTTLEGKVSLLPEVTEKLKAYKVDEGDEEAKALQRAAEGNALRDRERRAMERLQELFGALATKLREQAAGLSVEIGELVDEAILGGPNGESFRGILDLSEAGARELTEKADEAARLAEDTRRELAVKGEALSALHLEQEKAYQDLLAAREQEKDKATERDKLLRHQAELQEEQKKLEKCSEELRAKEQTRTTLLRRLSDSKDARFGHRTKVAELLTSQLDPMIRVQIEQYGNAEPYRELLLEAMKGSGFKYTQVVDRVVQRIPPHELAATVQAGDVGALADHLEIEVDRANRLLLQLKDRPAVYEVEVVDLHDRPTIQLKDGQDYKDSTALSTGQKCTTILPILLLESASPLLIDQPEDNLDNAFIYETVVRSVRGVEGKRQLIFVTHNPNIPVLGEAQKVVVLQSTGRQGSVKASGTVDEVKDEIETILEGGREAFQRRKARYGY